MLKIVKCQYLEVKLIVSGQTRYPFLPHFGGAESKVPRGHSTVTGPASPGFDHPTLPLF